MYMGAWFGWHDGTAHESFTRNEWEDARAQMVEIFENNLGTWISPGGPDDADVYGMHLGLLRKTMEPSSGIIRIELPFHR